MGLTVAIGVDGRSIANRTGEDDAALAESGGVKLDAATDAPVVEFAAAAAAAAAASLSSTVLSMVVGDAEGLL